MVGNQTIICGKVKNIYKETAAYLCDQLDEKISKQYYLNFLRVDRAASLKMAGYFRLPGTYNSKAKKWETLPFYMKTVLML